VNDLYAQIMQLEQSSAWDEQAYCILINQQVTHLLDHDINQLFNILYRIDISEHRVKDTFQHHNEHEAIAKQLTLLIIERLKQKIALRKKYSSRP
jgi:hypothetical protein